MLKKKFNEKTVKVMIFFMLKICFCNNYVVHCDRKFNTLSLNYKINVRLPLEFPKNMYDNTIYKYSTLLHRVNFGRIYIELEYKL